MSDKNICGPSIKQVRIGQGLTQAQLSELLEKRHGVSLFSSAISAIERQKRVLWDYELAAFADVLEVRINWLMGWDA